MIALPLATIERRARAWQQALTGLGMRDTTVRPDRSAVGGGSLPGETLPTVVVAVPLAGAPGGQEQALRRLRQRTPPLIGRAEAGDLLLDPRTVFATDDARVPSLVAAALADHA